MAELATIARPYAEALFKAAASDLAGTTVWLDALAAIASMFNCSSTQVTPASPRHKHLT